MTDAVHVDDEFLLLIADIGAGLDRFMTAFDRKLTELATSTVCDCVACTRW